MNMQDFFRIIIHRWWVIGCTLALSIGGAWAYSHHQQRIYQASATVFAHPAGVTSPGEYTSDVGLLTYGTLAQTFSSLAQSMLFLHQAGASLGIAPVVLKQYSAIANPVQQTTVLKISVEGPNARLAAGLANALVRRVAAATAKYYHIFALTPLDDATVPTSPSRPRTAQNILYGGLAGLIVGFIIAAMSLYLPALAASALDSSPPAKSSFAGHAPVAQGPSAPRDSASLGFEERPPVHRASAMAPGREGLPASGLLRRPHLPMNGPGYERPSATTLHEETHVAE